jgi:GTP pyrophosphokinase
VDFAYRIHTDIGHHCVGARVNGRIVPLPTVLENGDIIEVLVNRQSPGPSADWLQFVRTPQAKTRIRQWHRRERRQEHLSRGREILDRELRRLNLKAGEDRLQEVARRLGHQTLDELCISLSEGTQSLSALSTRLREEPAPKPAIVPKTARARENSQGGVLVRGQGSLLVRFGRCCQPVPGDPIIGYLTRGRGVSVHRLDCPNLTVLARDPEPRMVEVAWDREAPEAPRAVELSVRAWDRPGLLADVATVASHTNILNATARGYKDRTATVTLRLEVGNLDQLTRIIDRIGALPYVLQVDRVSRER